MGAQPTKAISNWATDKIAPDYWVPNAKLVTCHGCKAHFEQKGLSKHHCRGCGQGFCNACTKYQMPVPRRGWTSPVRVCKDCYDAGQQHQQNQEGTTNGRLGMPRSATADDIRARKVGEALISTINSAASILDYPKGKLPVIKNNFLVLIIYLVPCRLYQGLCPTLILGVGRQVAQLQHLQFSLRHGRRDTGQ